MQLLYIMHILIQYTFFAVFYITVVLVTFDVIGKRRGQSLPPPDGPKLLTFSVDPPVSHSPRLVVPVDTNTDLRLGCRARNVEEPIQVSVNSTLLFLFCHFVECTNFRKRTKTSVLKQTASSLSKEMKI